MAVERLILAAVVVVVALIIAGIVQRRRPDAPTQSRTAPIPQQLDRADFASPTTPWLIVVFSSDTCDACEEALTKARSLESEDVGLVEVTWQASPEVHKRYAIETVPMLVIAGPDGAVNAGFIGPPPTTELWAAMASAKARHQSTGD